MPKLLARRLVYIVAVFSVVAFSHSGYAAEPLTGAALIEAQLEEAKKLLAEDTANQNETARKKRLIDEKIAARKEREAQIQDELKQLCTEQEALSPGTLDGCLAKLNN